MFSCRSITVVLIVLSIVFLGLVSVPAAQAASTSLKTLDDDLRQLNGPWDDQNVNENVDASNSKKHAVMNVLPFAYPSKCE